MVTTCRTNSRVSFLKSLGTRSPLRSNLIERPLDAIHWDDVFRYHFLVALTNDSMDSSMIAQDSRNRRPGAIYGSEEKNLHMTSCENLTFSSWHVRANFPALSTPRKILRKRPRRFENPQAGFSGVEFFQFVR